MGSLKLFFIFLSDSFIDFKANFKIYFPSYIAFLFVNFIGAIPWEGLGFGEKSFFEIVTSVIIGLTSLVIVTNIILIEKSKIKAREKEKLLYAAPTYLIYTLYSTLIILACFVFLIFFPATSPGVSEGTTFGVMILAGKFSLVAIPAVLAAVCVAMVPLASVLIDNDSVNYFKLSFQMAIKAPLLIFCFGASALLVETPAIVIDLFATEWMTRFIGGVLYSFVDSIIIIILTKASVTIFYYLKNLTIGESVY